MTNERLFDLVRYQRSELLQAGLITQDEYDHLLIEGSNVSVKRLEGYDKAVADIRAEMQKPMECGHPKGCWVSPIDSINGDRDFCITCDRVSVVRAEMQLAVSAAREKERELQTALFRHFLAGIGIEWGDGETYMTAIQRKRAELQAEIDRLTEWKKSASHVLDGVQLQEVGAEIPSLQLGDDIGPKILPELIRRGEAIARLRAAVEQMVCDGCGHRIGWNGMHDAKQTELGRTDWKSCNHCRHVRAALAARAAVLALGGKL